MANVTAKNAKEAGDILVFAPEGADTPGVYAYVCPVDSHYLASAVRLQYDSAGSPIGVDAICPVHHAVLTGETFKAVK